MTERRQHAFVAIAFVQNFELKELATHYPNGRTSPQDLRVDLEADGEMYLYPFGAIVFHDAPLIRRDAELARLRRFYPELSAKVSSEEFQVSEDPEGESGPREGALTLVQMTPKRASVIALTVGQSVGMEYYEQMVATLHERLTSHVERLRTTGTVTPRTRTLHRFIGEAIAVRTEVLTVLHSLDKPDATWDDPVMDAIYEDLQDEFDLSDRFDALEAKLRSVQESLQLILDVARDYRLVLLEVTVVALILFEIVINLIHR